MTDLEKRLRVELARWATVAATGKEAERAFASRKAAECRVALAGELGPEFRHIDRRLYVVVDGPSEVAVVAESVEHAHQHKATIQGNETGGVRYHWKDTGPVWGLSIDPETVERGRMESMAVLRAELASTGHNVGQSERTRWGKARTQTSADKVSGRVKALQRKASVDGGLALARYLASRARWIVAQTVTGLQVPSKEERKAIGERLAEQGLNLEPGFLGRAQARLREAEALEKERKAQARAEKKARREEKTREKLEKTGQRVTNAQPTVDNVLSRAGYAMGLI